MDDFVLLLQEVQYHPKSYLEKLNSMFEVPSVIRVMRKEELRRITKPPLFDEKYLVLFDDIQLFEANRAFISFNLMFPVLHVESARQMDDAKFICKEHGLPFSVFQNIFSKEDAAQLIQAHATTAVSDDVCKAIVRQVGLNPLRIITAVSVCEQMGYTRAVVEKYIDKWVYPDLRKLIECLLGVPPSARAVSSSLRYLHLNRHWYSSVRRNIEDELDSVLEIYKDKISGNLYSEALYNYIEEKRVTRARVMFALRLFERVSIASIFALREFIKNASLVDVVLQLS